MSSKLIFVLLGAPLEGGVGAAGQICANFATCSWEPLAMLNPQFVAGEHGLFGGHKSEDIRTFFKLVGGASWKQTILATFVTYYFYGALLQLQ